MDPHDPEFRKWAEHVKAHVLEPLKNSAASLSLVPNPEDTDIKFAVELGLAIMLDKPIIALVQPGTKVSDHLVRVADRIIEADLTNPGGHEKVAVAIQAALDDLTSEDGPDGSA